MSSQNDPMTGTDDTSRLMAAFDEALDRLERIEERKREPIAIIGIGCRFPGRANDPDGFWRLLMAGTDAVTEVRGDRWDVDAFFDPTPNMPGKMYTLAGAFLEGVDQFDPQFFGITPREAMSMDPQQRLFLEVCWEALQRAAYVPEQLSGSKVAVIAGGTTTDFGRLITRFGDCSNVDAHFASGNVLNAIAGRVSYLLGLRGPALAVDSACSSSLVAVHLACQGLRAGEFDMALAGGVNLILTPEPSVALCQARMLSPDGRCKSFDAAANGYVRGEGCGVLLLKPLSRALADGDPIVAQIRGSAVNQDGKSSGFTVPNGPAQSELIERALRNAGVEPSDIGYLEAHGTGTSLGDPIEIRAAASVLCKARGGRDTLVVGSVKTNIGHLESAAGIAGLIKSALAVHYGTIPQHLHFAHPSPHIDWENLPIVIPTRAMAWEAERRLAGVSSFGASGTNAHVVIEKPPVEGDHTMKVAGGPYLLTLSGKNQGAVRELAGRYASALRSGVSLADFCFTGNTCRSHYAFRAAVVGMSGDDLAGRLERTANTDSAVANVKVPPRVGFLFTGQGSQYAGMGRRLFESEPVFRDILRECDALLREELEQPLLEVLFGHDESVLGQTAYTQPALFVLEYALAVLWISWGIRPAVMIGHSIGEYAAACVADVFSLRDALRLVTARARLIQALPPEGSMIAVLAPESKVHGLIEPYRHRVSIAAVNAPQSIVISGDARSVDRIVERLECDGVATKRLAVSHAFHSPLMEPMMADFERIATSVRFQPPRIRFISNLTGMAASGEVATAEYWVRHIRATVRFADGIVRARSENIGVLLEIGPKPILTALGRQCISDASIRWLASLQQGADDSRQMRESLGELYCLGATLDWSGVYQRQGGLRRISIPTYPFQKNRFWTECRRERQEGASGAGREAGAYVTRWEAILDAAPSEDKGLAWILFADSRGVASALGERLGDGCSFIQSTPSTSDEIAALLAQSPAEARLLFLRGLDVLDDGSDSTSNGCRRLVDVALEVMKAAGVGNRKLWLFTRNAAPVDGGRVDLSQAAFVGLCRAFAAEFPQAWGGLIDLAANSGADDLDQIVRHLKCPGDEDEIAFRGGRRHAPRLVPAPVTTIPFPLKKNALYLISGGFGALGSQVAEWLVRRGAGNVALIGRNADSGTAQELIHRLEKRGATALAWKADVADAGALEGCFRKAPGLPIAGIIHAAGVLDDGILAQQSWGRFERVLSPKIEGAWNLYQLTRNQPLDFFCSFSSVAALLGSVGQGSYAMANAFLDGFAYFLRQRGVLGISVQWGPWAGSGMAGALEKGVVGMSLLDPRQALRCLGQILSGTAPQLAIFPADWEKAGVAARTDGSLLKSVCVRSSAEKNEVLGELQRAASSERRPLLYRFLRQTVGTTLGLAQQELDGSGFADLGMDSLMAVEIRDRLQRDFGVRLPATLAFNYPTLEKLTQHLLCDVLKLDDSTSQAIPSANGSPSATTAAASREPIAIVGMACRLPGGISDPEEFWEMLRCGRDAFSTVPASRWEIESYFSPDPDAPAKMYVREGAFLDQVDQFDPQFFGISPREACRMDPQQRLLLEVCWEALENAALPVDSLPTTGMFLGIGQNDYLKLSARNLDDLNVYDGTGNGFCFAAGRISFAMGLQGPCLAVDTACSSSLVAVHLACQSLRNRECGVALAGGVHLMLTPDSTVFLSKSRALSPTGRVRAFDDAADGYVRGEGCGVIVLRRFSDAVADRNPILAVVRGSAVNHDGRSSGLTVPNGLAQEALLCRALFDAGVQSSEVAYVEAHGTGTPLGDPIEVEALGHVFGGEREEPLLIGSAKTNIGHLEPAAGIASLLKVVLAIQHGQIPPHLNFKVPNRHIAWERIPIRVAEQTMPWPAARKRIAGVSSFGLSGTNAHVVLEGPPNTATPELNVRGTAQASRAGFELLALSAKTLRALRDLAAAYARLLSRDQPPALADVCFTSNTCRTQFEERACFIADSGLMMAARLNDFAKGEPPENTLVGGGLPLPLLEIARRYVAGKSVDWTSLYGGGSYRKILLPNYPFQRKRYWVESNSAEMDISRTTERLAATGKFSEEALAMIPELLRAIAGDAQPAPDKFYEAIWKPTPRRSNLAPSPGFGVLIIGEAGAIARRLEELLLSRRRTVVYRRSFGREVNPDRIQDFERLFAEWSNSSADAPLRFILYVVAEPASDVPSAAHQQCVGLLHLVQALSRSGQQAARIWVITRNAVVPGERKMVELHLSPLWGFGRVIALEYPHHWGGLIDVSSADDVAEIAAELDAEEGEEFVALHDGRRSVLRLEKSAVPRRDKVRFSAEASYLITGGLGALGIQTAEWLVRRGAQHVCLLARRPAPAAIRERFCCFQADVADEEELWEVFRQFGKSRPPLAGIIHAAGLPGYEPIAALTPERFAEVLRAKVTGGWLLHELSREHPIEHFICYSSIAAVWGSKSQAHYAAANQFLDSLAVHRRAIGLPGLSVNWGPWSVGGMATEDARAALRRIGIAAISPGEAFDALDCLISADVAQRTVANVDWPLFRSLMELHGPRHFLQALGSTVKQDATSQAPAPEPGAWISELSSLSPKDRRDRVASQVSEEVAHTLQLDSPHLVQPQQGFSEMGMDSLMAVELSNRLKVRCGLPLTSTVAFDYPNVEALSEYLLERISASEPRYEPGADSSPPGLDSSIARELAELESLIDGL
jgi:acyl transferase domain-containing protein/acyl carrier protein